MTDFFIDNGFLWVYFASGSIMTWYRPLVHTLYSRPEDNFQWLVYWSLLSILLFIENNFLPILTQNLVYYFVRTLFLFYLSEQKSILSEFKGTMDESVMKKIGSIDSIKVLCSMISDEEEVDADTNLHPWAPTPSTVGLLAVCRIGEICSTEKFTDEDDEYLVSNGLDKIIEFLKDTEDSKSQNSLVCLLFLTDRKLIRNRIVCMDLFPVLRKFIDSTNKQLVECALRLCRNIYNLNLDLQREFIKQGFAKRLLECLKEADPLLVIEAFDNIFSLICVSFI
jgi:hypothetical protein